MENIIVDLHSHAQMKAYGHSFKSSGPTYQNSPNPQHKNSVWWSDWPTSRDIRKNVDGFFGLAQFTQADMVTSLRGGVQVSFSSLYPLENGFTKPFNKTGSIADGLVNSVTQFGKPRINFTQKIKDYFPDLEKEYEFQLSRQNEVKKILGRNYKYKFVKNYDELEELLTNADPDVQTMAVINSIEGAHCFGTGLSPFDLPTKMNKILGRIKQVKEKWEYPPFFVTLAHHFYNEICGHAKSLGLSGLALNQKKGMNTGFTEEGKEILACLLDEKIGQRILIDVKHMSLNARMEYYQILKNQYNFSIPIIVSHGCVTGYHSKVGGKEMYSVVPGTPHKKFNSDDINFYDFELVNIKESDGIFGIQLDERRVGSNTELAKARRAKPRKILFHTSKLVWNQIQHIAEVLDQHGLFAWDIQSIGSDFDGIINPIDGYFTAIHFDNLSNFLLMHAHNYVTQEMQGRIRNRFNHIEAEEIVDRFMGLNALEFLRKYFTGKIDNQVPEAAGLMMATNGQKNESNNPRN